MRIHLDAVTYCSCIDCQQRECHTGEQNTDQHSFTLLSVVGIFQAKVRYLRNDDGCITKCFLINFILLFFQVYLSMPMQSK